MKKSELKELYQMMFPGYPDNVFASYPDVVNVSQLREMLGNISRKTAYGLLQQGEIHSIIVGRSYRIPKVCVIEYLGLK